MNKYCQNSSRYLVQFEVLQASNESHQLTHVSNRDQNQIRRHKSYSDDQSVWKVDNVAHCIIELDSLFLGFLVAKCKGVIA